MNLFTVTPNKDATGWFVKIEDTAPTEIYSEKDQAIEAGIDIAKIHAPSRLVIHDKEKNTEEMREFLHRAPS